MKDAQDHLDALIAVAMNVARAIVFGAILGLIAVVVFGVPRALAQTTTCPTKPTCDPITTKDRAQCGAEIKGTTSTGQWRGWWYPVDKGASTWTWCPFTWAMLDKYAATNPRTVMTIVDSIKDASDPEQAIVDAIATYGVKPAAGSQDEYEFKLLFYAACTALQAAPPNGSWTSPPKPCVAPTPPVQASGWKAIGSTIFKFSSGKLTVPTVRKATPGADCDGVTKATVGATVYQSLVGGPADEVTGCAK